MRILTSRQFREEQANQTTTESGNEALDSKVFEIIRKVREGGDRSLYNLTNQLDGVDLDELTVSQVEFTEAMSQVSQGFLTALRQAKENITTFHQAQTEQSWYMRQSGEITLGQQVTPLDKVGVYIPGGKAAYPSSVLMNVVPARLAGVGEIAITTPPQSDGSINSHVLTAAKEAGADRVYKIGGAQAIAALAYGTETVDKVDKIVGPGNAFVSRAKKWVYGDVAIDMIAGPSEICVVADETAPVRYIAADLLSQAEHDESARAICVTASADLAEKIAAEVQKQSETLDRKAIIQQSLKQHGQIIVAEDLAEACEIVNQIAPEHLQLMIRQPEAYVAHIRHAGAIFLGNYSPEPLGDYFAGPNHTLPTSATSRFASPLGVYDFVKKSSIIQYSREALLQAGEAIQILAVTEGLTAHANAIKVREDDTDAAGKD